MHFLWQRYVLVLQCGGGKKYLIIRIQLQRATVISSLLVGATCPSGVSPDYFSRHLPSSSAGARVWTPVFPWRTRSKSAEYRLIVSFLTFVIYKMVPRGHVQSWGRADSEGSPRGQLPTESQHARLQSRHKVSQILSLITYLTFSIFSDRLEDSCICESQK